MNETKLQRDFQRIGARLSVTRTPAGFSLDVRRDRAGSMFALSVGSADTPISVLDVQTRQRHLVLQQASGAAQYGTPVGFDEHLAFID